MTIHEGTPPRPLRRPWPFDTDDAQWQVAPTADREPTLRNVEDLLWAVLVIQAALAASGTAWALWRLWRRGRV